uniref:Immunoglobulin domain-containing protein n=1 Tax=Sinocyclocheilus anshuiensis TaxID=1608454 RepID=A0A671TDI9_9TELE
MQLLIVFVVWKLISNVIFIQSVSVMEGDSVTLNSGLTEIQTDDEIEWRFGHTNLLIAELSMNFKTRLKLDHQTGSLTITNTRTTDSGLYEVKISSSKHTINQRFNVTVSDAVKSVSVTEGDSVSLESGVTEIQTRDVITWHFGHPETHRLKLDHQTGSLTITNTRTTDSGLYTENIKGTKLTIYRFRVTVYGVFADADAVTSVSVTEGDSVSLESGLTEIQTRDLITWTFGHPETRIAQMSKEAGTFSTSDGDAVGFRDRVKLDHQTGCLTITNTRTTDSGLYHINIKGTKPTTYRFSSNNAGNTHQIAVRLKLHNCLRDHLVAVLCT